MKLATLITGALLVTSTVKAEIITSRIHSTHHGEAGESSFIRLTNGRVVFIQKEEKNLAPLSYDQNKVRIQTDNENNLISIMALKDLDDDSVYFINKDQIAPTRVTFEPTVLKDLTEANKVFNRLNWEYQRVSQCFNRAHVWASEEYTKNKIKSQKGWVFFTASYITRNRFLWWFHVAPMFDVMVNGKKEPLVMDHRFSHRPQKIKEWTDMFVYSKRSCKVTTKFSEYDVNPQTEDCYWMTTPMYYWQPTDIHNQELDNKYKTEFYDYDVKSSYSEAF